MTLCACGRPLHYTDPHNEEAVAKLVADLGEYITVHAPTGSYRVARHFIALHGLKAEDLPRLAEEGIVERLPAEG